jgi:hypothetical protein
MYRHCPLKGPPKFTQTGIFGTQICMPSGNPDFRGPSENVLGQSAHWKGLQRFTAQRVIKKGR